MNVLGRRAPPPQPGPSQGAAPPRSPAWRPARAAAPTAGDGSQAGGPRSSASRARVNRRAALLQAPSRSPSARAALRSPPPTHTRPPAAVRLGVGAIPPSPTAFPSPGPHSPPLRRSPHLPQQLSLPDWPSRDLTPISQSPPLAGPRLTSERLAAAWGRAQERRAEGVSAPPTPSFNRAGYLSGPLCARAEHSKGRVLLRGCCFVSSPLLPRLLWLVNFAPEGRRKTHIPSGVSKCVPAERSWVFDLT